MLCLKEVMRSRCLWADSTWTALSWGIHHSTEMFRQLISCKAKLFLNTSLGSLVSSWWEWLMSVIEVHKVDIKPFLSKLPRHREGNIATVFPHTFFLVLVSKCCYVETKCCLIRLRLESIESHPNWMFPKKYCLPSSEQFLKATCILHHPMHLNFMHHQSVKKSWL